MPTVKPPPWELALRRDIRTEFGTGWSLSAQSGKTKLTRRYSNGTRSSVMLDIPFSNGHKRDLLIAVGTHVERMGQQKISLRESHRRIKVTTANPQGQFDWAAAVDTYTYGRRNLSPGTQQATGARLQKLLLTIETRPRPKDGRELMAAFERQHLLGKLKPGSEGRRKSLQEIAKFLKHCIEHQGLDPQWSPVTGEVRQELVGAADGRDARLTPPLQTEALVSLLKRLEADGRHDVRLAVGLVAIYGLRPAELATLEMVDGQIWVSQVKRNAQDMKRSQQDQARGKRRMVLPLDPSGLEGLGAQLAAQWASGLVKLPLQIRTAITTAEKTGAFKPVGDAFRQLLDRYQPWLNLVAATPGLTPYSLRHSWAWRAHKGYSRALSVRDAAALLGHNPETHHKFYGRWVDEQGLLDAVAGLNSAPMKSDGLLYP